MDRHEAHDPTADRSWQALRRLVAATRDSGPTRQAPDGSGGTFTVRVADTGPDRVAVLPGTPSGDYRICVLDQDLCTPIVVTP